MLVVRRVLIDPLLSLETQVASMTLNAFCQFLLGCHFPLDRHSPASVTHALVAFCLSYDKMSYMLLPLKSV